MPQHDASDYVALLRHSVRQAVPRLGAITPAAAITRPAPDKWSPVEVIGHLVDSASNNHGRFVRAALEDDLVAPGYEQEAWVGVQRYREASWPAVIELWAQFNMHLAHVMASIPADVRLRKRAHHSLHEIAWSPVPADVPATLAYFMADYVAHLRHHVAQVLGPDWDAGTGR
jgi:hypothetical protein